MGTVFRRSERRPVPASAEVIEKGGKRFARWKSRGRTITAEIHPGDGGETVLVKSGVYVAKFTDHTGKQVERSTGCRDESTARQKLAAWEKEVEQIGAGVLDPDALTTARAAASPLAGFVAEYERSLVARALSSVYRRDALRAVRRIIKEAPLKTLRDLRREVVEPWFARVLEGGMRARTRNLHREAVLAFANWLRELGKLQDHDLLKLPRANTKTDPVRQRRALTVDEIGRLLNAARTRSLEGRTRGRGTAPHKLSDGFAQRLDHKGRERELIYRTLLFTGLRLNELRTLTVGNLDLTPGVELLCLDAANEKNGVGSTLPLRTELAEDLRGWIKRQGLTPSDRLFRVPRNLLRTFEADLKAAEIPKRDERGRTVDLHALRTTFGTFLSATGTAPRTAQQAMRHSDIKLTMTVYTDPALLDVRKALDNLPAFAADNAESPGPKPPTKAPPTGGKTGQFLVLPGNVGRESGRAPGRAETLKNGWNGNEKPPLTTPVISGGSTNTSVPRTGLEPAPPCEDQHLKLARLPVPPPRHHVVSN